MIWLFAFVNTTPIYVSNCLMLLFTQKLLSRTNKGELMKTYSPFSRRDMLKMGGASALLAASSQPLLAVPALAKAKPAKIQVPGFYRFTLGKFEITILSDGYLSIPVTTIAKNVPEAQLKSYLKSNFYVQDMLDVQTNVCLINTGKHLVMIDTGCGTQFQKSAGRLSANLKASGYKPEDIDAIVLTHAHPDHAWGIIDASTSKPRFPNAEYYINAAEWDFWTDKDLAGKLPKELEAMAQGSYANLVPVSAKTKRVKAGDEILPGVLSVASPGHTVGHMSFIISSEKENMLITGDTILHQYVSFDHSDWHFAYDMDPELAVKSRKMLLDMAAKDQLLVVGYHLAYPGVGHVARRGSGYRWVPADWQWQ